MKNRSAFEVFSRLILLVKPLRKEMTIAIVTGILGFISAMFITILGAMAVAEVLQTGFGTNLNVYFWIIAIAALSRGFLRYAEQTYNHYIAFKLLALIRDRVFEALRRLAPAKLEGRDKGGLISVITSDIEMLEVFYAHTISPIVIALVISITMVAFISFYNFQLGLLTLLAYICVGIVIPYITSIISQKTGDEYRNEFADMNSYFLESMRGMKESIQYDNTKYRLEEINKRTDKMLNAQRKLKLNTGINSAITSTVVMGFSILMFVISGNMYLNETISFSAVVVTTVAMFSSFGALIALSNLGTGLSQTIACGNRVLDILDESPIVKENSIGEEIEFEGVKFDKVGFSYGDENILDNINYEITNNKIIGFTGKSGVGKSTALRLLMRFWDVKSGVISFKSTNVENLIDVKNIRTNNLRDNESYVTQETHLFHDSIYNNIRIAKLDATDEEVIEACKKASIHDFIMTLSKGYDTEVAELGESLSGGERQRIGVARAFLHDAPLMLLDEPTSNLDSLNEAVILKSLKEDMSRDKSRTIVIVSHRESTMKVADIVYNFESNRDS